MSYIQIIFLTISNLKSCIGVFFSVSNSIGLGRKEAVVRNVRCPIKAKQ